VNIVREIGVFILKYKLQSETKHDLVAEMSTVESLLTKVEGKLRMLNL
jgi:hypothetical protein